MPGCLAAILLRTVPNYKHPRTSHPTNFTAPQLSALVMCCKNLFHSHSDRVFLSGNKLVMCVNWNMGMLILTFYFWNGDDTWADYHRDIILSRLQTEASETLICSEFCESLCDCFWPGLIPAPTKSSHPRVPNMVIVTDIATSSLTLHSGQIPIRHKGIWEHLQALDYRGRHSPLNFRFGF